MMKVFCFCSLFFIPFLHGQTAFCEPFSSVKFESSVGFDEKSGSDSARKWIKPAYPIFLGTAAASAMGGLYFLWYKDYPMESFHFFDDLQQWGGMDKLGHVGSGYGLAEMAAIGAEASGYNSKQANRMGAAFSFGFLTGIEVFDGFSKGWGFSPWDALANGSGVGLFYLQQKCWKEQRIRLKFSWWPSGIASWNPNLLGDGFPATLLKDYNAQRYWLSVSPSSFSKNLNRKKFSWIAIALGYGIDGYVGARANEGDYMHVPRTQHFYLAPDIHWSKIPSRHRFVRGLFRALDYIKIPSPTLEFGWGDQTGLRFHWLFF
jgi:hypothetical protein